MSRHTDEYGNEQDLDLDYLSLVGPDEYEAERWADAVDSAVELALAVERYRRGH